MVILKKDALFNGRLGQSKCPVAFELVYFKSLVGLRLLLVFYLMN